MRKLVLLAVALSGVMGQAAPGWAGGFKSGNSLLENCQDGRLGSYNNGMCLGYIMGIVDALDGNQIGGQKACFSASMTGGQIRDVVVKFLQSHPEIRHYQASGVVTEALAQAFPCR